MYVSLARLVSLMVLAVPWGSAATPKPFTVYWNWNVNKCISSRLMIPVYTYGILYNDNYAERGNVITMFNAKKHGHWPYYEEGVPKNGGIPQAGDLPVHLKYVRDQLNKYTSVHSTGHAIFNQELYPPFLNPGNVHYTDYTNASFELVARQNPSFTEKQIKKTAIKQFEEHATNFMEETVALVRQMRPNMTTGYYAYPRSGWHIRNNRMTRIWGALNGLYPSIYIKDKGLNVEDYVDVNIEKIAFAQRIRHNYTVGEVDILPYVNVLFPSPQAMDYLINQIQLAADMGCDGVVIWGSSSFFQGDRTQKCRDTHDFLHAMLGPFVVKMLHKTSECSKEQCSGHGRCVLSWCNYMQDPGANYQLPQRAGGIFDDYSCHCYNGWTGTGCSQQKQ